MFDLRVTRETAFNSKKASSSIGDQKGRYRGHYRRYDHDLNWIRSLSTTREGLASQVAAAGATLNRHWTLAQRKAKYRSHGSSRYMGTTTDSRLASEWFRNARCVRRTDGQQP